MMKSLVGIMWIVLVLISGMYLSLIKTSRNLKIRYLRANLVHICVVAVGDIDIDFDIVFNTFLT